MKFPIYEPTCLDVDPGTERISRWLSIIQISGTFLIFLFSTTSMYYICILEKVNNIKIFPTK